MLAVEVSKDPQFWIAASTFALAVLTFFIALIGAATARAAYMQARLEDEPRLIIQGFTWRRLPAGASVSAIYEIVEANDAAVLTPRFNLALLTGEEWEPEQKDDRSHFFVAITNTGRSPVFAVRLNWGIRMPQPMSYDPEADEPIDFPDVEGEAETTISALPEGLPTYIGFSVADGFAQLDAPIEAQAKRWMRPFYTWWMKPRLVDVTVIASSSGTFTASK